MLIMGPPTAAWAAVHTMLMRKSAAPVFIDEIAPLLWDEASRYGVDPLGVVAQSAKETNYGRFTNKVPAWFHNTCGLKVHPEEQKLLAGLTDAQGLIDSEHRLMHARFPTFRAGARAHVQHLRAYADAPVPEDEVVAPRYFYLLGLKRRLESFEDLNGRWAGPAYGTELVALARSLTEVSL